MSKELQALIFDCDGVLADTEQEDFSQADLVVNELGEVPNVQVSLETVRRIIATE